MMSTSSSASSLALLPLGAEGLQLNEANRLNELLQARSTLRGYDVQDQELTTQLIEASQALGVRCDVNAVGCGVELGKLAGVQFVLVGQAAKLPVVGGEGRDAPTIGLDLRLIDVKQGFVIRRILRRVATEPEQQKADVDVAADALMDTSELGRLQLDVLPLHSACKVDGAAADATAIVDALLPGQHIITATHPGFMPWTRSFAVAGGEAALVEVRLALDPAAQHATPPLVPVVAPPPPPPSNPAPLLAKAVQERVLVLDFRNDSARADLVGIVRDSLVVQISRTRKFEVLSSDDLRRLTDLEAQKQAVGCTDSSCLTELAGAVGARLVVFGNVGQLADITQINISLLDVGLAQVHGRETIEVTNLGEVPKRVRRAAARLFGEAPAPPWGLVAWTGVATAGVGVAGAAAFGSWAWWADATVANKEGDLPQRLVAQDQLPTLIGLALGGAGVALVGVGVFAAGVLPEDL